MSTMLSSKIIVLIFGILAVSFLAAFYAIAWQEPGTTPPQGNVTAPLNTGVSGQTKGGWLASLKSFFVGGAPSEAEKEQTGILRTTGGAILNTGGANLGLIVQSGNVGIGITNPSQKLEVAGRVKGTELCIETDCRNAWPVPVGITAVDAGTGLTGGGDSGEVTLNLGTKKRSIIPASGDYAYCPAGEYVCGIKVSGGMWSAAGPYLTSVSLQCCGE